MALTISNAEVLKPADTIVEDWKTGTLIDQVDTLLVQLDKTIAHDIIQTGYLDIVNNATNLKNDVEEWASLPLQEKESTVGGLLVRILDILHACNQNIKFRQERYQVRYKTYLGALTALRDKLLSKEDCSMPDMIQVYAVNAEIDRVKNILKDFDPESVTAKEVHAIWVLTTRTLSLI